ncbi:MAG: phosphotriesterase [Chloroflexi bacterium]|nr:phosphotriesterase [Chloroflexota bacterium]
MSSRATPGQVQTVLGPVAPGDLGFTLPHEHTKCSLWWIESRWDYWELIGDEPRMNEELAAYKALGGGTLVDVTPIGIGRDLARLARLSQATGLHIVAGAGWYRQAYYPAEARIDRRSIDDLADEIVQEFVDGPVRPGIIGEIGTDKPWVTAQEERVFRAAARAALRTGASVTTHAVQSDVGLAQLAILEDEGLDPARIVIGHCDSHPRIEHWREIVRRGAHVEADFLGMSFTPLERAGEPKVVELISTLLNEGFEKQILLSQDVCHDSQLASYGGNGYTYLQRSFLPQLVEAGVNAATIKTITVENPARLLTLRKPA